MPDDPAAVHVACAVNATLPTPPVLLTTAAEHSQFLQVCLVLTRHVPVTRPGHSLIRTALIRHILT